MYRDFVTEENGQFIVKDTTSGGYVDRMTHSLQQRWTTKWDKDLNLLSLKLGFENLTEVLSSKDKEHYDYHRAVRTRSRHLRILKDYLGIEYNQSKKAEKKEETIIFIKNSICNRMEKLKVRHVIVHKQTIDDGISTFKKYDINYARLTPEKEKLMEEYNQKLEEFKQYQKDTFKILFDKE